MLWTSSPSNCFTFISVVIFCLQRFFHVLVSAVLLLYFSENVHQSIMCCTTSLWSTCKGNIIDEVVPVYVEVTVPYILFFTQSLIVICCKFTNIYYWHFSLQFAAQYTLQFEHMLLNDFSLNPKSCGFTFLQSYILMICFSTHPIDFSLLVYIQLDDMRNIQHGARTCKHKLLKL